MYPNYQYPYQNYVQYQPVQTQPQITGKIVDDFNLITANDVPMTGEPAVFIKRDMSCIQLRKWGNDGRIYTSAYNPIQTGLDMQTDNLTTNTDKTALDGLNERLTAIEEKIDKLIKPTAKKGTADAT